MVARLSSASQLGREEWRGRNRSTNFPSINPISMQGWLPLEWYFPQDPHWLRLSS